MCFQTIIFPQNVLSVQGKAVPLYQQNPPRFPKTSEPGRGVFLLGNALITQKIKRQFL